MRGRFKTLSEICRRWLGRARPSNAHHRPGLATSPAYSVLVRPPAG